MNRRLTPLFLLAGALAFGAAATAQTPAGGRAPAAQAAAPQEFTQGEVRNVDKADRKVTLKHGEIKNLGMPPMAMVFEVKDAKLLDKFKIGDKVRFKAVHDAGKYVLVDMQADK